MRTTPTVCALSLAALSIALAPIAQAQTSAAYRERVRLDTCLGQIQIDPSEALERAQTWRLEGGGWPAEVCEARALIELGEPRVGADILVSLAERQPVGMVDEERAELYILAGDTRFAAGLPGQAASAYEAALALVPDSIPARLARARLLADAGDWMALAGDAEALIAHAPYLAAGWRYRGQSRLGLGELDLAWQDMERAREQEPDDIPSLLLRGAILEARRLDAGTVD
ncbi:hypothetical protein [Maricaulis sp.]|uniref:hypothetical protein n=1 Tax=Maricaulis sp. TaxID=1486257 RepID=UPI002B273D55|nr:hypothetical protein [Maricaulis sp.]